MAQAMTGAAELLSGAEAEADAEGAPEAAGRLFEGMEV